MGYICIHRYIYIFKTSDYVLFQQHVNSFCWTHSLYQYPNQSNLNITPYELNSLGGAKPDSVVREEDFGKITFYRWVTVVFLLQAFLFKVKIIVVFHLLDLRRWEEKTFP